MQMETELAADDAMIIFRADGSVEGTIPDSDRENSVVATAVLLVVKEPVLCALMIKMAGREMLRRLMEGTVVPKPLTDSGNDAGGLNEI